MAEKDVVITYETLFELLRIEKNREDLQKLDVNFFNDVLEYLKEKRASFYATETNHDMLFARDDRERTKQELDNIKKILKDLYDRREKKIVMTAINKSRTGVALVNAANMLPTEKKMFNDFTHLLTDFRKNTLHKIICGELPTTISESLSGNSMSVDDEPVVAEDGDTTFENNQGITDEEIIGDSEESVNEDLGVGNTSIVDENSVGGSVGAASVGGSVGDIINDSVKIDGPNQDSVRVSARESVEEKPGNLFSGSNGSSNAKLATSERLSSNEYSVSQISNKLSDVDKNNLESYDDTLDFEKSSSNSNNEPKQLKTTPNTLENAKNGVIVKFLDSIGEIVGPDLQIYGPYQKGDEMSLPMELAKVLIENSQAESSNY